MVVEDLAETLNYCIVWLYNMLYESDTRREGTKIGLLRVLDKAFCQILPLLQSSETLFENVIDTLSLVTKRLATD